MVNIRSKIEITIPIIVTIYVLNLLRLLLLESQIVGTIIVYIVFAGIVALGSGLVPFILYFMEKLNISKSTKKLLYWFVAIVGGVIVYRQSPLIEDISRSVFESMPDFALISTDFIMRLTPSYIFGGYVMYIVIYFMFLIGLTSAILEGYSGFSYILSSIKIPLYLCAVALFFSIIAYESLGPYMMGAFLFLIVLFGQHKMFAKVMVPVKQIKSNIKGFKLYLSVRKDSDTHYENPVDNAVALAIVGVALLAQIILFVTFIVYLIFNFSILQDVVMQWF